MPSRTYPYAGPGGTPLADMTGWTKVPLSGEWYRNLPGGVREGIIAESGQGGGGGVQKGFNMPTSSLTGQPIGTLRGAPGTGGAGTYGKVPQVPDPAATQAGAITGNMGNLGGLYGLTGSLNTEIANQARLPYELNLPNYAQNIGQEAKNTTSLLQGQVPQDVANQIAQMAAERGVSTGSIGSPNANSALMRALGVTSLGLQQQGAQNMSQQIAQTPTGQQFNPQTFLTSPAMQQEMQYLANLYSAAPTPGAGDQANLQNLLKGLGGLGGPGGVRGGAPGAPGADFFGQVNNMGGGGLPGGGGGGGLGWPGGAQSGQPLSPGIPYNPGAGAIGTSPWETGVGMDQGGYQPWNNDLMGNVGDLFAGAGYNAAGQQPTGWQAGMPYSPGMGDQSDMYGGYAGPSWSGDMFSDMGG